MNAASQVDQIQLRGAEYTRKRHAIGFLKGLGIGLMPWLALQGTISDKIRAAALSVSQRAFPLALVAEFLLMAGPLLVAWLVADWFQYRLNVRYGVSLQKPLSALADIVKGATVRFGFWLVSILVIYSSYGIFRLWWWVSAGTMIAMGWIAYSYVFPSLILPLFFRMSRLEDPGLLAAIRALAARAGVTIARVCTLHVSDKFNLPNLAIAGIGKHRVLVLTDTILQECSKQELEALLAHELGHIRYRDVEKRAACMAILSFVTCWIGSMVLPLLDVSLEDIGSLPTLFLSLIVPYIWGSLLMARVWRKSEFRADEFAFKLIGDTTPFVSALRRISEKNLLQVTRKNQHRFGHPATEERIRRAETFLSSASVTNAVAKP